MNIFKYLPALLLFSCEVKQVKENEKVNSSKEGYPTVETVIADLDNDKIPDTVRLNYEPEHDPGEFTALSIEFSSLGHFQEKAVEAWDSIPRNFMKKHKNAVESSRIFVRKEGDAAFLLLFGYPYPAGSGDFSVVSVGEKKVHMQRITRFKEAEDLTDLDGNGTAELIGRNIFEIFEASPDQDGDIGTYSPFYVLYYKKEAGSFILDPKLTRQYNIDHYVWKGMDYSEHIKVFYPHNGGKPHVVD